LTFVNEGGMTKKKGGGGKVFIRNCGVKNTKTACPAKTSIVMVLLLISF